nr:hypothetical protein [Tanacetum cinerariifolium]
MLEEGNRMWRSIEKGPYARPIISNPDNTTKQILEPLSKMTKGNKKQYIADVRVMNYLLQAIPNDIYNSVDAFKNAKDMWQRLMFGSDVASHPFLLIQMLLHHNLMQILLIHHNHTMSHILHIVADYEDEYHGELQGNSQEDKLTTAMMLLARAITQKFSTPTNNRLRTSSNTINQVVIQDGRVDIQTKNAGYDENGNRNVERQNRNNAFNGMMKVIRLFSVFHELSQLRERQMFSVITAMKKATMLVIVGN